MGWTMLADVLKRMERVEMAFGTLKVTDYSSF